MSSKEPVNVKRAEVDDPKETLKAQVEAQLKAAFDKAALELTEVPAGLPFQWEVWARGPYQDPGEEPGRIIALGQKAYLAVVVWMNPPMQANEAGHGSKILLNFWTSNTQRMAPVPAMDHQYCIDPADPPNPEGCWVYVWEFTPTEAACLLETNICVRLCNCNDEVVPGYAGFVRWVLDFDPVWLWPTVRFDHPVRYLVYDDKDKCSCP